VAQGVQWWLREPFIRPCWIGLGWIALQRRSEAKTGKLPEGNEKLEFRSAKLQRIRKIVAGRLGVLERKEAHWREDPSALFDRGNEDANWEEWSRLRSRLFPRAAGGAKRCQQRQERELHSHLPRSA
jgi:hypothetical protein